MYDMYCKIKRGLNQAQKEAIGYYNYLNKQMDRYCESVFYVPGGSREREIERRIQEAVKECQKIDCGQYC